MTLDDRGKLLKNRNCVSWAMCDSVIYVRE